MNICKNKCECLITQKYHTINKLVRGFKRCRTCCICIKTDEYRCPCCNRKLTRPVR